MHKRLLIKDKKSPILYISHTTIDKSFQTTLHSHPHLEILLFMSAGKIITTNKEIPVEKGSLITINPNSKHAEIGTNLAFFALGIVNFHIFSTTKINKKINYYHLEEKDYQAFLALYKLIYNEANYIDELSSITELYQILLRLLKRQQELIIKHNQTSESDLVNNVKGIIENNFSQPIYLDELAATLNISKSSLCHNFKKATNLSIIAYKLERQLEEAKNLLLASDMNIIEVANLVGFNNAAYFTKLFRTKFGCTPKNFRLQNFQTKK